MATAYGLAQQGDRHNGRFRRGTVPADNSGSRNWGQSVAQAGIVLDHASDLVDRVLSGDVAHRE